MCIPLVLDIFWGKLEPPFSKGAASLDLLLQTVAVRTELSIWEVFATKLELVKDAFIGHVATIFVRPRDWRRRRRGCWWVSGRRFTRGGKSALALNVQILWVHVPEVDTVI